MKRRDFLLGLIGSATPFIPGCGGLNGTYGTDRTYYETISSFLISQDGKKIVVLGEQHHYIFDASDNLTKIRKSSFRPSVYAKFSEFYIKDDIVKGGYTLILKKDASKPEKAEAKATGFQPASDGSLELTEHMTGTVYSAEKFESNLIKNKFNSSYNIMVVEAPSKSSEILVLQ